MFCFGKRPWLLLCLLISVPAMAQVSNPSIISVSVAPSGACSLGLPNQQVVSTGIMYSCQSGTWASNTGGTSYPGVTSDGSNGLAITGKVTAAQQCIGSSCLSVWPTSGTPSRLGYTFYVSGGTTYAQNNTTGNVDYSGTDAGAVVRSAIAHNASVCGKLQFANGTYNVNSLVLETSGGFSATSGYVTTGGASIYYAFGLPGLNGTATCEWIIDGESSPSFVYGASVVPTSGVIFYITPTALSSVSTSVMVMGWWARPSGAYSNQAAFVKFKSVDVRFPDNTRGNETAFDCSQCNMFGYDDVQADTAVAPTSLAYPTAGTLGMYGLVTSQASMAGGVMKDSFAWGYYTSADIRGEHTELIDDEFLFTARCIDYGFRGGPDNAGATYHGSSWIHPACGEYTYGVTFGPNLQNGIGLDISVLGFEDNNTAPWLPVYHAMETIPGGTHGTISYYRVLGGIGESILNNLFDGGGGNAMRVCGTPTNCAQTNAFGVTPAVNFPLVTSYDLFNRANGALGSNWSGAGHIVTVNDQAHTDGTTGNLNAWYSAGATATTQWASAIAAIVDGSDGGWSGLTLRVQDTNDFYAFIVMGFPGTGHRGIYKVSAGVWTPLYTDSGNVNAGDVMEFSASGSNPTTLTAYQNGLQVQTATDSTSPFTSGYAGIAMAGPYTTQALTSFETGN